MRATWNCEHCNAQGDLPDMDPKHLGQTWSEIASKHWEHSPVCHRVDAIRVRFTEETSTQIASHSEGPIRPGMAEQGQAGPGPAWLGGASLGNARRGMARSVNAWCGPARQARQGVAGRERALVWLGEAKSWHGKARQMKIRKGD